MKEQIDDSFKYYNDVIHLFHDLYENPLKWEMSGIQSMSFTIHPIHNRKYQIDLFLKLIQTSESLPFIKYNPGHRKENIYRLYTNTIATNGKKIP